jgi:hypothetical protein
MAKRVWRGTQASDYTVSVASTASSSASLTPHQESSEFERFRDLSEKLVKVSKSELNEQREKS